MGILPSQTSSQRGCVSFRVLTLILSKTISTTTGLWMSGGRREETIDVIMQHTTKGLSKMYCPETSQNASRELVTKFTAKWQSDPWVVCSTPDRTKRN